MSVALPLRLIVTTALLLSTLPADAREVLYLTTGRTITVDRYWEEGDQILYEKNGGTFGFPRALLERVDRVVPALVEDDETDEVSFRNEIADETLAEARESARDGDTDLAADLYQRAIDKAPDEVAPRLELAELYFARGDLRAAQSELEQAKRFDPDNAGIRERLGDVYYRRGRSGLAIREWQTALASDPSPGLLYKLKQALRENDDDINFEEVQQLNFVIRYDGQVNEAIGRVVAAALDEEYYDLEREFRFSPREPIRITLYTNREFQDVTHAPSWASGLNDGEIRIPVEGLTELTPNLRRIVRHELTHSFVNALTNTNCPSWFHEGLAQLREGGARRDPYPILRAAQAEGRLLPLWSLEGPLVSYTKDKAQLVYAEALAATEYVVARRGADAPLKILRLLARQQSMNDALKSVVGLDYQEFQTAWETDLERYRPPTVPR
jgi:tetratricopeptide (TPR) repeat protein